MSARLPQDMIDKARAVRVENVIAERGIKLSPGGIERCGPCPVCGGRDRFSINTKKQVWNCRGCANGGDVIKLICHLDGLSFKEAVELLAGHVPPPDQSIVETKKSDNDAAERRRKINSARGIWNRRLPIIGTVAEYYLRFRGLEIDEDHLRYMGFDPEAGWREEPDEPTSPLLSVPCLLAVYRAIDGDEIVAVQKTRLIPDGSKWVGDDGKTARRFNGCPKGAAIKIDPDEDVTMGLILGEGLESCLSARALGFRPVWAVGTAGSVGADGSGNGGIAGFPVLKGVESLTLLTERDEANKKATAACTRRWQRAGKEVLYADPPPDCGDVNDILQRRMARA